MSSSHEYTRIGTSFPDSESVPACSEVSYPLSMPSGWAPLPAAKIESKI